MKKILLSLAVIAATLAPGAAPAAEQTGFYLAPKFALNVQHSKGVASAQEGDASLGSKTGVRAGGALALGYDFAPQFQIPVRAELEYGAYGDLSGIKKLRSNVSLKRTVGIQTLLANVYWDIAEWNGFTPYVGAGAGVAFLKTEGRFRAPRDIAQARPDLVSPWSDTDTVFAGQIGLGCSYAITDSISADFGYRFLMMDHGEAVRENFELQSKENRIHQVMLGLRVTF